MNDKQFMEDLSAILDVDVDEINADFLLTRDNWNSLSIVSTIVLIDEQFGIAVAGEKLRECTSVGELWQLIKNAKLAGN